MKYLSAKADYPMEVKCKNNLLEAYKRIGEINPYNIKNRRIKKKKNCVQLSERQLVKRGILNIKRRLNGNLGKSGKYSNTMLKRTANIVLTTEENIIYMKTTVPKEAYIKISVVAYLMLWAYDQEFCKKLLEIEANDKYPGQDDNMNFPTKAMTPIQTNILIRSKGNTDEVEDFIKYVKMVIK